MNKNIFAVAVLVIFAVASIQTGTFAAEQKTPTKAVPKTTAPVHPPVKPSFGMIAGTITNIDNTDPNNIKLQVKSDADGSVRAVTLTPWTNITKVTDASELKTGETIRMMTRKVEDKDVAMGIMFGKIKTTPPMPAVKAPAAPIAPAAKVKK